mmetsp:Transcript_40418/g.126480  ORF Transcript_40418/g.126480 Transcript_40418/m.126480 type:complete len:257 (-) Transcript_40418:455-1225(-)
MVSRQPSQRLVLRPCRLWSPFCTRSYCTSAAGPAARAVGLGLGSSSSASSFGMYTASNCSSAVPHGFGSSSALLPLLMRLRLYGSAAWPDDWMLCSRSSNPRPASSASPSRSSAASPSSGLAPVPAPSAPGCARGSASMAASTYLARRRPESVAARKSCTSRHWDTSSCATSRARYECRSSMRCVVKSSSGLTLRPSGRCFEGSGGSSRPGKRCRSVSWSHSKSLKRRRTCVSLAPPACAFSTARRARREVTRKVR